MWRGGVRGIGAGMVQECEFLIGSILVKLIDRQNLNV